MPKFDIDDPERAHTQNKNNLSKTGFRGLWRPNFESAFKAQIIKLLNDHFNIIKMEIGSGFEARYSLKRIYVEPNHFFGTQPSVIFLTDLKSISYQKRNYCTYTPVSGTFYLVSSDELLSE